MNQPRTVDRGVALIKFVLGLLRAHPDGKRPRDIYMEIESKLPLDNFDKETMRGSGLPRWRAILHFHSVAATKAGLLVKSDGRWRVTDEGQKLVTLPDYELKRLMRSRYREWRWSHQKAKAGAGTTNAVDETPPLDTSVLFEDAKEKARDEIDTYLDTLTGYEFQNLVAALLEGMGYATSTVRTEAPISSPISIRSARRRRISGFRSSIETRPLRAKTSRRFEASSGAIGK
jgi:restriction system protein